MENAYWRACSRAPLAVSTDRTCGCGIMSCRSALIASNVRMALQRLSRGWHGSNFNGVFGASLLFVSTILQTRFSAPSIACSVRQTCTSPISLKLRRKRFGLTPRPRAGGVIQVTWGGANHVISC